MKSQQISKIILFNIFKIKRYEAAVGIVFSLERNIYCIHDIIIIIK